MEAELSRRNCHGSLYRDADALAGVWGDEQYVSGAADIDDDAYRVFMQYVQGVRYILEL